MVWLLLIVIFIAFLAFKYGFNEKPYDAKPSRQYSKTITIDLTGYTHYEEFELRGIFDEMTRAYIIQYCKYRHPLELKHEPNNPYSDTAIQVFHEGFHIGYVPDEMTEEILPLIQYKHTALISSLDYRMGYIDMYIKLYFTEK